jgi:hypothetical protein
MQRREFLTFSGLRAASLPASAYAQQDGEFYRVIQGGQHDWKPGLSNPPERALHNRWRELDMSKYRCAEGEDLKRASEIGAELIREGIDLIVVGQGSMAKQLTRVTSTYLPVQQPTKFAFLINSRPPRQLGSRCLRLRSREPLRWIE